MPKANRRLFLLDASSYLFRAYFAIGHLSNAKGIPTNATYGFVQMLMRLIKEEQPTHFVAVWDRPEPTFRKQEYQEYKAQREEIPADLPEQIDWIKKILQAMHIPILEKAGFEADDIIGTIAKDLEKKDYEIIIVTGDKDLMQLVNDRIILLDTMKNKWTRRDGVLERFGVTPEQVVDVLGLAGDSSDNIPGVPGIGGKTAAALIQQYGSIENLYLKLDELKGKRRESLEQNKDAAFLSKKLATIHCEVPIEYSIEDFDLVEPDQAALNMIFEELEFNRLVDYSKTEPAQASVINRAKYELVNSSAQLLKWKNLLEKSDAFAFDTETTSLNVREASLVGLSFCVSEGQACYIPVGHAEGVQLPIQEVLEALKPALESESIPKIAQNFKYDYQILKRVGVEVENLYFDPMIASYLLDPAGSHGLDYLAQTYLHHKMIAFEEVTEKGKSFADVPLDKALAYSAEDAEATYLLAQKLEKNIQDETLDKVFQDIELPLESILARMELRGIKVDRAYLKDLQSDFTSRLQISEKKIFEIAKREFNVNSPKQLGQILFEELKLPVQKKTKTGYSTDVDVLTELAKVHPLPEEILVCRSLSKLKSTYVDSLLALADAKTDRIHTSFNQTVAETGRLSSTDPNLQNIPIRTSEGKKIRQVFIAEEGFQLLSADYSQIELRVLAHLSEDPVLIEAFEKNLDIHRMTAASIFGLSEDQVTPSMRASGKTVNFGVVYGQSPFGLAGQLGIPQAKAKEYIEQYFARYSKVKSYREKVLEEAREKGVVRTLYGRLRRVNDIHSKNPSVRNFAERIAFNTVIQGTAADLIKVAMIRVEKVLREKKLESRMLLQVHDELVFEVREGEVEVLKALVKECMEGAAKLKVPLLVETGMGKNWNEAH